MSAGDQAQVRRNPFAPREGPGRKVVQVSASGGDASISLGEPRRRRRDEADSDILLEAETEYEREDGMPTTEGERQPFTPQAEIKKDLSIARYDLPAKLLVAQIGLMFGVVVYLLISLFWARGPPMDLMLNEASREYSADQLAAADGGRSSGDNTTRCLIAVAGAVYDAGEADPSYHYPPKIAYCGFEIDRALALDTYDAAELARGTDLTGLTVRQKAHLKKHAFHIQRKMNCYGFMWYIDQHFGPEK